jgi:hypothetical protein
MSTSLFEFINQTDKNWKEVDLLLKEAERQKKNENLRNAICRSVTILIITHLEGFIKGLVKSIVSDLNQNCNFEELPLPIQRTYCIKYVGDQPSFEKKIKMLMEKFCSMGGKITPDPFFFPENKNPKPEIFTDVFSKFGISKVFSHLHESDLDDAFAKTNKELEKFVKSQRSHIIKFTKSFPYNCLLSRIKLDKSSSKNKHNKTLWEEFLNDANMKRHKVVHGNEFINSDSVQALKERKLKAICFQYGLVELMAGHISKSLQSNIISDTSTSLHPKL